MSFSPSGLLTAEDYDRLAWEYYQTLPLEHFMEATPHATQREIAVASLALLKTRRKDVQYFNELLVQYVYEGNLRRVVPDNMVVIGGRDIPSRSSYAVELEPAPPFMMLEYVSPSNEGKDYEDSFRKYERELETPYCLFFHPQRRDLQVFRHEQGRYVQMEPNVHGRIAIPELDLEVGLRDGWARFWHRGALLEIPDELDRRLKRLSQTNAKQGRELRQLRGQMQDIKGQMENLVSWLRERVEQKARLAGREDILSELSGADHAQLQKWLDELEAA
jgi:Uma2 family endonuclease